MTDNNARTDDGSNSDATDERDTASDSGDATAPGAAADGGEASLEAENRRLRERVDALAAELADLRGVVEAESPEASDAEADPETAGPIVTGGGRPCKVVGTLSNTSGVGVYGENTAASGENYGIEAVTQSTNSTAAAVRARAPNGARGVEVSAADQIGVRSKSTNSFGVSALSDSNVGLVAGTGQGFTEAIKATNFANSNPSSKGYGVRATTATSGADSAAIRGKATSSTGAVHGVMGVTDSADGYGLYTPDGAHVEGAIESASDHTLTVDGTRTLSLGTVGSDNDGETAGGNVIGGYEKNAIRNDAVGATVGGGGSTGTTDIRNVGVRDNTNEVTGNYGTIGGGVNNRAKRWSTVSGGAYNTASSARTTVAGGGANQATSVGATVGGGEINTASANYATIPGGEGNTASRTGTFAAGQYAKAEDSNAFVWNDGSGESSISGSTSDQFSSSTSAGSSPTGVDTFHVKSTQGVRFVTSNDNSNVTYISANSTGWSNTSTRAAKTNVDPVDTREALAGVEQMEISTWEYKDSEGNGQGQRHIGPMAEEFHEAFDVGDSDEHINSINADGAAFAAIQGLSEKHDEKDEQIAALKADLAEKDERIDVLEDRLGALEAQIEASARPADD